MAYRSFRKPKPLILGTGENYLDHEMEVDLREEHMHVVGAPKSGKSRFLLSLILQDIKASRGVCVIDPHGELIDHVKDWLGKNEHITTRRNVHILDFNDLEYSFGFDPLAVKGEHFIPAVVESAVDAIATANSNADINEMPLLANTLSQVCTALAYAGLSLDEAKYLTDPFSPDERLAITATIKNPEYAHAWMVLNEIARKQPFKYFERFEAASRRISAMTNNPFSRAIIGQKENVLDLKKSMDDGDIILLNLSVQGGYTPKQSAKLLGRLMVSSFLGAAFTREGRNPKPFNLYIDEAHNFLSGDIPQILEQCRKFGLHLTIAHQHLGQLKGEDEKVYDGVMAAARNKICFALDNPEDAEIMQRRIFAGHYDLEKPKTSMNKPVVVGHEIMEMHSRTASQTEATTEGFASAQAISYMKAYGHTKSYTEALSETEAESHGTSRSLTSGTNESSGSGENSMSASGQGGTISGGVTDSAGVGSGAGAGSSLNSGVNLTIDQDGNPVPTGESMGDGQSLSSMDSTNTGVAHTAGSAVTHNATSGTGSSTSVNRGSNQAVTDAVNSSHSRSIGKTESHGTADSVSEAEGNTQSEGQSSGVMRGKTASQGVSQSLRPILEERPTVLYSLEELKHLYVDSILLLPKRTAFAVLAGQGMTRIETLDVPDIIVSPTKKARVINEIKMKSPVHKPTVEAEDEIRRRMLRFMNAAYPAVVEDVMNPEPQDKAVVHSEIEPPPLPDDYDPMNPRG